MAGRGAHAEMAGRGGQEGIMEPVAETDSQPNSPPFSGPPRRGDPHAASGMSMLSAYPGGGPAGMMPAANGLDLSFGYTPLQFEKINLIGSQLSEQAISSLVLSVPNITYLDLRGNNLNAAFGWRLVKAMKKRYLQLEYCNGVHMRALRDNAITSLSLSSFPASGEKSSSCPGHIGMYGIEVVGAIFLAHFLRLNSSLTYLDFRRNDVQKDGAKALAQSLLGNPQCALRTVNTMGPSMCPRPGRGGKPGIDFALFRTSQLQVVHLSKRCLDDDDFVFLEEWLRRYDCVTDLDISHNLIHRDGLRKLTRHVKDTKVLRRLNCVGLPVDLEGTALLARAVVENNTLEHAALSLGPCDENPERQQMFQQLAVGMMRHPTLNTFGLANSKLFEIREGKLTAFTSDRVVSSWNRAEAAVYMWFIAAMKPRIEKLRFGSGGKPTKEYPMLAGSPPELWPPLIGCIYDLHNSLKDVNVTMPKGYGPLAMEFLRALQRCSSLEKLHINGYASASLRDSQLPQEWTALGAAPRWLVDERVKNIKVHWQALFGLLNALPRLQEFNDIPLDGGIKDKPETTVLLLLQCLEGVAADFTELNNNESVMVASLQKTADVNAFCDVLRILHRTPLLIRLSFSDKSTEVVKKQQLQLAYPLSGVPAGDNGPRFTHAVELKNNVVSADLLQTIDCNAPLREFCFERVDQVLPQLFTALCQREKILPVKKIRIEPKWNREELKMGTRRRFSETQRQKLDGIQAALIRSDVFEEIDSGAGDTHDRQSIEAMSPEEFAILMSGIQVGEVQDFETYAPHTHWRYFPSYAAYVQPEEGAEELFVPLPLNDEGRGLGLQKLSLCMCNLRPRLTQTSRPDEWPQPSKPLWAGPRRFVRCGDWNEYEPLPPEEEREGEENEEDQQPVRYHWRENLKIGSKQPLTMLARTVDQIHESFVDNLIADCLRSFFEDNETLQWLDLRGNGLTKEDADLLLELVEQENQPIETLNLIPVAVDEAANLKSLVLDGACIDKAAGAADDADDDPFGDGGTQATGEAYARESLEADYVRLDVGDGFIFLQLMQPKHFPELANFVLRKHEIPDETLPHITDALLGLPSISQLQLSDLRLSSRGASLLLSAVAEMAPRLISLNGLPLARLVQLRDNASDQTPMELGKVDWNDFTLGVMSRLSLWPVAVFPVDGAGDSPSSSFHLQGKSLTDVGMRGLCAMLRHFATQERSSGPGNSLRGAGVYLTAIDLAGNGQITDQTVADLCHTMQHPTMGTALRHSLRDINIRSCPRLRTRSAFELLNLLHHVRDVVRDGGGGPPPSAFGNSLQTLNGVDLQSLQATMRAATGGGRVGAPPMLIRSFVELGKQHKANFPSLSECDMQFFAGVLHLYSQIPYCHVHIVVPAGHREDHGPGELPPWGRDDFVDASIPWMEEKHVSNDSPFPAPVSMSSDAIAKVQAHFNAARRLFESCPIATQLRVSACPVIPSCQDILSEGDALTLLKISSSDRSKDSSASSFGRIQQRIQEQAQRRRRKQQQDATPRRPLYVNNINSQQLHDCFRTLYGQDDLEVLHTDILPDEKGSSVSLSTEVDVSQLFGIATSVDLQHLDLGPSHFGNLRSVTEMPVLTHINLNHNHLCDQGIELLFSALVAAGCSVVHVAASSNNIGDAGASTIAYNLAQLPRLTSLELCDNFIQENGSIALAEAVGGNPASPGGGPDDFGDEAAQLGPLPMLSVDLRGNRSRELGAMRWAEVVSTHPTLQFLCLAQNELGRLSQDSFLGLVYAAVASAALSVLDLRDNFPLGPNQPTVGPPPDHVIQELLVDLPPGEFDPAEVRQGVFIRRHRGGGGERKGRQGGQPGQGGQASSLAKNRPSGRD